MGRRTRIGLVAALAVVCGALAAANVVGTSAPAQDRDGARLPLAGPDAPAPGALSGVIVLKRGNCDVGRIELEAATAYLEAEPQCPPPDRANAASPTLVDGGGNANIELPIDLPARAIDVHDISSALEDEGAELLGIVGYDINEAGVAGVVVAARGETNLGHIVQLWTDAGFERSVQIRNVPPDSLAVAGDFWLTGRIVRLSPGERELVIISEFGASRITTLDLVTRDVNVHRAVEGLDWSPDGRWLALSTGEEILVFGESRSQHIYVIGVGAEAIEWRDPGPDGG